MFTCCTFFDQESLYWYIFLPLSSYICCAFCFQTYYLSRYIVVDS